MRPSACRRANPNPIPKPNPIPNPIPNCNPSPTCLQEVLAGQAIQFDGAGNKATQQSARGVPQGWSLDTLDESKKVMNA